MSTNRPAADRHPLGENCVLDVPGAVAGDRAGLSTRRGGWREGHAPAV